MVDYWNQSVGKSGPYHFKDNSVSDMLGIYNGQRYATQLYDLKSSRKVVLYSVGIFKFSNKLLEKLKSFGDDPIKAYEFLNPGQSFTASEKSAILSNIKTNKLLQLKDNPFDNYLIKTEDPVKFEYEYSDIKMINPNTDYINKKIIK